MEASTSTNPSSDSQLHFLDYWRVIRIRKTVIIAVLLLVVVTVTIVTFLLPPTYRSTVRMEVRKDAPDVGSITGQQSFAGYDPYFLSTEFRKIQSSRILNVVIQQMGLMEEWGKRYQGGTPMTLKNAYDRLRSKMMVDKSRDASLIEISVDHEDPEEAAALANRIAEVYREDRLKEGMDASSRGIVKLEEELKEKSDQVRKAQEKVDKLRAELGVSDPSAEIPVGGSTIEPETLRRYEQMRIEAEAVFIENYGIYTELTNMTRLELRRAVQTAFPDSQMAELTSQLDQAEQKRVTLLKDFGEKHPEVERVNVLIGTISQQLDERMNGHLRGLQAKVSAAKQRYDAYRTLVEQAKAKDIEAASRNSSYFEAKRDLESLKRLQETLKMKIIQETIDSELPRGNIVQIYDIAVPEYRPVAPKKGFLIVASVVIGLVLGIGLAFFIEYLDTSVKTLDDVERALQAPVLGVIPQNVGSLLDEGQESPHAEAYRVLRSNMLFSKKDGKFNTICVVSAGAGEGKSTTIFNLACTFAQSGQRVIIVDSDLRRPSLQRLFKVSNAIGLTNYLQRQNTLEEVIQTSALPTLDFLPSGRLPSSSVGILNSVQMKALIHELKRRYDFVFFDSPPILGVSDASILTSEVDMTLLVVQYRKYPQAMTLRAKQMVEKVGGNLIGIVLNNINMAHDSYYYYYSGFYSNYYKPNEDNRRPTLAQATAGGGSGSGDAPAALPPGDSEKLESKY